MIAWNTRTVAGLALLAGVGGCLLALLIPHNAGVIRLAGMASALLALGGWTIRMRHRVVLAALPLVAVAAGILLVAFGPEAPVSRQRLRDAYLEQLGSYEGTRYVWGGEGRLGVDCSGLPRLALRTALYREGLRAQNFGALRSGLALWWNDASARAMRDGYRGDTVLVGSGPSVNALDHTLLQPGDLAVTADGGHMLAYLGDRTWIEAEPEAHRVVRLRVPVIGNHWFERPVLVVRWAMLDGT